MNDPKFKTEKTVTELHKKTGNSSTYYYLYFIINFLFYSKIKINL